MSSSEDGDDDDWGLQPTSGIVRMERCMLGKEELLLPEVLMEQNHIFREVLSMDTWNSVLTESQRTHLMTLLPKFPENDFQEKLDTVRKLFEGENFKFGNPLTQQQMKMKDGFCSPDIAKYASLCRSVKFREYKYRQQRHYSNMLKDILLARQKMFEQLKKIPPDGHVQFEYNPPQPKEKTVEHKVKKKYVRLMKEVRQECGYDDTSSEEEEYTSPIQRSKKQLFKSLCPIPSPEPMIPTVVHTFSAKPTINGDVNVAGDSHHIQSKRQRPFSPVEVSEDDYKQMLKNYKRKKSDSEEEYPDLNIQNITLQDIMARCQATKKSPKQSASQNLSVMMNKKKKIKLKEKTDKKLKKVLKIKAEDREGHSNKITATNNEDGSTPLSMNDNFLDVKEESVPDFPIPETYPPKVNAYGYPPKATFGSCRNFFSLMRDLLMEFPDGKVTTVKLEEKVREWQESPSSSLNNWFPLHSNWVDYVMPALKFLAGDLVGVTPDNFVPYVDYKERAQQWRWIGVGRDSDESMAQLFNHWMANKKEGTGDSSEGGQGSPPPPRIRTSFVVRATSDEEKALFREQEKRRFENPHKAFTYQIHGYECVVGPVKGVYTKDNAMNKAREHALLVSSRPSYVTILTLVRDSAARLPNGEGTRGDICELLKDSQFLSPGVSDAQINVVVSGALDRLHSEKDPCVKYDVNRKLWIYLHRSRSEDEFERIHQAHGAAQKAKKSLQKPKTQKTQQKAKETSQAGQSTTSKMNPSLKSSLSASTENLSVDEPLSQTITPSSPCVVQSPKPGGSPLLGQVSPRALPGSPHSTPNQATIAALKNVVSASVSSGQASNASILQSPTSATIRFQLQQQQLQQQQKAASLPGTPKSTVGSPTNPSVVSAGSPQLRTDAQSVLSKSVPLGLLQNIRATNPNLSQANLQNLTSALRHELIMQRQASSGSTGSQQSPVGTPTQAQPVISKVLSSVTPTTAVAIISTTSTTNTTMANAQLMSRLVQQVAGSPMVSVSNLLAAQRAQGPRGSTTLKIQGGNLVHPVRGGKPVQLAGKPLAQARGQLVQITGKGPQLIQAPQGGLQTISIIPQGGTGGGVMTLGQPQTPPVNTETHATGNATIQRGAGNSNSNSISQVSTTVAPTAATATVQVVNQPKVVTPSQGGIVVTQLTPGLTLRPGTIPVSSQAKVVSAGQAGLLPAQFIVQQTTGVLTNATSSVSQSIAGGVPLIVSGTGGKPGQNIQVVRTVLGQQGGLKPGQTTILISPPNLQSSAGVLHASPILQSTAKLQGKGVQQTKAQPVYARIITPPPGQKLATVGGAVAQTLPSQGIQIQTVNKLISVSSVANSTSPVSVATAQATAAITMTTQQGNVDVASAKSISTESKS